MNKQLVVAVTTMTTVAMIATSCISTPKSGYRRVASEPSPEVVEIANQGIVDPVGKGNDFANKPFRVRELKNTGGDRFNPDMTKYASALDVKLIAGQVITDNDLAFDQKIRVIESAKKELRMVYFIYSDDDSSSKLNKALIEKAKQKDFKAAYLMVDFITNYKNLDLFIALNKASGGKIQPFFYNFPSSQIYADANFITLPCPKGEVGEGDACYNSKMATINGMKAKKDLNKNPTAMSKIFLTGIYGKNPAAMKVAMGLGAQINPEDYKKQKATEEDGEALLELAKLSKDAFINGSIIAKIKLSIAMSMYGEKIYPIMNELTGRLPLRDMGNFDDENKTKAARGAVWDHLTDYTHHKLVLADADQFVMGGRNVEDSYHMDHRVGSAGKYIFSDTDFWGQAVPGGAADMATAFNKILGSSMVAPLATVQKFLSYDFIANSTGSATNPGATEKAVGYCMQSGATDLGECILSSIPKMDNYLKEEVRVEKVLAKMDKSIERFAGYKSTPTSDFDRLSPKDMQDAKFFYLENSNTDKQGKRVKGSNVGFESENNKNIQAVWYRALENTCKVSAKSGTEKNVIFNTAYLLMPAGMVHRLAQMMNGDFGDCSKVKVTFITNSPFTTDLAPINVLARYQLGALFDHYAALNQIKTSFEEQNKKLGKTYKQFWPKMEYYEFAPADAKDLEALNGNKPKSLHTKTSLIGDDLIVGSANADVRSYAMDTNNAMMIRNASEMNAKYIDFIYGKNGLIAQGLIKERMGNFQGRSFEALRAENEAFLIAGATRWNQAKRLDTNMAKEILEGVDEGGQKIYNVTKELLIYRGEFDNNRMDPEKTGEVFKYNDRLNKEANALDNMFKVF